MHEVVEYLFYRTPEGRAFSRYSSYIPANAELVNGGFTIRWADGTEGTMKKPFETREQAEAYLAKVRPTFKGMSQIGQ
jgi:hypothetical protein